MKSINVYRIQQVKESEIQYDDSIAAPEDATKIAMDFLKDRAEEYMILICLNTKGKVVGLHEISHGDITGSLVHPREVYKRALLNNACSIIVAHNHPSGDATPSSEDIKITERLYDAGKCIGVELKDHIIIGESSYISLRALGYMKGEK